ncbi:hypothetical protein [uncultured Acidaminococcus sp.]|jgi:hypothetical protein|uniref:hypothetical protein n=1 Tax=uncultured Acidaminococcus sp. TaxID=352152 RepID=UPI00258823FD|nr:hypothetical protein [uncultured Acidaminococcus sp.]
MEYSFDWNYIASGTPYVSVSKLGISMNGAVIKQLQESEKIMIGFDEKARVIGIRPYRGENGIPSYEFKNKIRKNWIRIGCKDFVKNLSHITGINFDKAKKFLTSFDETTKTVYFKVEENKEL